ncbi:MAG TPA: hypothetical protein VIM69_06875 [Opitutaceae bacterium]
MDNRCAAWSNVINKGVSSTAPSFMAFSIREKFLLVAGERHIKAVSVQLAARTGNGVCAAIP